MDIRCLIDDEENQQGKNTIYMLKKEKMMRNFEGLIGALQAVAH